MALKIQRNPLTIIRYFLTIHIQSISERCTICWTRIKKQIFYISFIHSLSSNEASQNLCGIGEKGAALQLILSMFMKEFRLCDLTFLKKYIYRFILKYYMKENILLVLIVWYWIQQIVFLKIHIEIVHDCKNLFNAT